MLLSIVSAVLLAAYALNMLSKGHNTVSRRMAWIPAAMSAMEMAMCGVLLVWDYPVLTLLLVLCRVTVLGCCATALKRDAAAERNRRRRRAVHRNGPPCKTWCRFAAVHKFFKKQGLPCFFLFISCTFWRFRLQ